MRKFDLIVLGGGSGGLATAQRAAEYGARVALFEPGRLGGTCVNVGCVPKKVMWYAAELAGGLERSRDYGFDVRVAGHDWARLKAGRDAYVQRLNGIYQRNLDRKAIATIRSAARFSGPREIVDANGDAYAAEHVVIATGGYPIVPPLPPPSTIRSNLRTMTSDAANPSRHYISLRAARRVRVSEWTIDRTAAAPRSMHLASSRTAIRCSRPAGCRSSRPFGPSMSSPQSTRCSRSSARR